MITAEKLLKDISECEQLILILIIRYQDIPILSEVHDGLKKLRSSINKLRIDIESSNCHSIAPDKEWRHYKEQFVRTYEDVAAIDIKGTADNYIEDLMHAVKGLFVASEQLQNILEVSQMSEEQRLAASIRVDQGLQNKLIELQQISDKQSRQLESLSRKLADLETKRQEQQAKIATVDYVLECGVVLKRHEGLATKTLKWFVGLALVVFYFLLISALGGGIFFGFGPKFMTLPVNPDLWDFVAYAVSKLVFATFLIGLCVVVSRVYFAHQHNMVTLDHQRLAAMAIHNFLATLPTEAQESRHNIIVQCVSAICNREASGFLKNGEGNSNAYGTALRELLSAMNK